MSNLRRRFLYSGEDSLVLPAKREEFSTLKAWFVSIFDELNLFEKTKKQLLIAADEIFTNIAAYGYPTGDGETQISVEFESPQLIITFSDEGVPFNPLKAAEPDIDKPLAEKKIGGLGIFMVKKIMDTVEYRREKACNVLVMTKCVR